MSTPDTTDVPTPNANLVPAEAAAPSIDAAEIDEKVKRLRGHVEHSIKLARKKARYNRRNATIIKLTSLVLSAAVTILIGWKATDAEPWLKNIALTFAATVTLLTATEPFFNYRALWIEHEEATWRFYSIRDDMEYYLAGKSPAEIDDSELAAFHTRIRHTWDDLSQKWLSFRRGEGGKKPKDG